MSGCSCLPVTLVVLQIIARPSVTQDKRNMRAKVRAEQLDPGQQP
jgi:hypothetical protein